MHSPLASFFHISSSQAICNSFLFFVRDEMNFIIFLSFTRFFFPHFVPLLSFFHEKGGMAVYNENPEISFSKYCTITKRWKFRRCFICIDLIRITRREPNFSNICNVSRTNSNYNWKITTRYFVSFVSFRSFAIHTFLLSFRSFLRSAFSDRFLSVLLSFRFSGLPFELFHAYRYVRHVQFYEGKHIRRADGRRLIKAWVCALGVLVSTALGAGDDVAVWTPMASSQRPTPT